MPATTTIACSTCGTYVIANSFGDAASRDGLTTNLRPISDNFSFSARRSTFRSTCRSCERAARRNRVARATANATRRVGRALGLARTFGVEIELINSQNANLRSVLSAAGLGDWSVKYDGSLSARGQEIVSPVLRGEDGIEQIRTACRVLREAGCTINRTCGLHVHHDIRDLTIEAVRDAAQAWYTNQGLIDGLVAPSRRGGSNAYCGRISSGDMERLNRVDDLRSIDSAFSTRYRTFNLQCYGRYGTVEIRQHQGTLDAEKIISWLRFGQAIMDSAATGATAPTQRHATIRELFAALGDRLDETARTFLTGRAVEFGVAAI